MKFFYKPTFLKAFDQLSRKDQEVALKTDQLVKEYLISNKAPFGLRIKQLHKDIYEARLSDRLRIVWLKEDDEITFALLARISHQKMMSNSLEQFLRK